MTEQITERQLRVMIEHLPTTTPWYHERHGPFSQNDLLTHQVESRLRELLVLMNTALAVLKAGLHVKGGNSPPTPRYIPVPGPPGDHSSEAREQRHAQERVELSALMHRN